MDDLFDKQKSSALIAVDLSRKGSIDEEIVPLVHHINNHDNFFTTSSCSGRIVVFDDHIDEDRPGHKAKKKGCKWLFTSHTVADAEQIIESLGGLLGDAVFKFEPFVLHVQCRNTDYAQRLLCCAVASGFRNSGISLGNKGKIIVGVRSTHGLEAPLSKDGNLLVSLEFIRFLTKVANKKLEENFLRIKKFFERAKQVDLVENRLVRRDRKKKDKKSVTDESNVTNKEVESELKTSDKEGSQTSNDLSPCQRDTDDSSCPTLEKDMSDSSREVLVEENDTKCCCAANITEEMTGTFSTNSKDTSKRSKGSRRACSPGKDTMNCDCNNDMNDCFLFKDVT